MAKSKKKKSRNLGSLALPEGISPLDVAASVALANSCGQGTTTAVVTAILQTLIVNAEASDQSDIALYLRSVLKEYWETLQQNDGGGPTTDATSSATTKAESIIRVDLNRGINTIANPAVPVPGER